MIGERNIHLVIDEKCFSSYRIRAGQRIDFVECGFGPFVNWAFAHIAAVAVKRLQQVHVVARPLKVHRVLLGHREILNDGRLLVFHLNDW